MSLQQDGSQRKLRQIPPTHRIQKRPPLHPAIPSPYTGRSSPKVVYITASTPFISALKRAQKLLALAEKRDQSLRGPTDDEIIASGQIGSAKSAAFRAARRKKGNAQGNVDVKTEEIFLKGTGRAIQRTLELGLWFQQRPEYRVRVQTGELGVIDDLVARRPDEDDSRAENEAAEDNGEADASMHDAEEEQQGPDMTTPPSNTVPETRIRKLSVVEVAISWR